MLLNTSLDTSFWNRACQIGITAYLFSFFRINYCEAVRQEIITTDPLLINDQRPLMFAESLGIPCICVPEFCVFLYAQGKITMAAAQGYLERLKPTTSMTLITRALQVLEKYSGQNGG